ncbi:MAG: membrane-bound lytic murein transglycosylase B [Lysobacterales bacterium]|jgi:membrane-bound lytic murein transglycosylase B
MVLYGTLRQAIRKKEVMIKLSCYLLLALLVFPAYAQQHPGTEEFIDRAVTEYGLDGEEVAKLLAGATYQQSIVDAISRPAEGKPWHEYRPIFLTEKRISEGVTFWNENKELIQTVSEKLEVDPQIIVSIIGVETFYGRITGNYKVLDALITLGFYYPQDLKRDRSEFFSGELLHFLQLCEEENLPADEVTGSYAGAMGMGQFISSSYREYAVDFDENGSRDLWRSTPDVVGSVANYLHRHGWKLGDPVSKRAVATSHADEALSASADYKPVLNVGEIAQKGYQSDSRLDPERLAAVLKLEEENRNTYWLTFHNFYVITRYNRSPLYAMAVLQLSEEILKGMGNS